MGLTQNLGRISAGLTADASLNIGVGVTPSGTYKFQVNGGGFLSGSITADDLILTAGTLFGAGNTGFSNRLSDTTLYLQMPASGFNITDNALNTKVIISSTGAANFSYGVGVGVTPLLGNLSISHSAFSNAGTKAYTVDNVGGISAYVSSQDPYRGYLDIYSTRSGDGGTLGGSIIRFLTSSTSTTANAIERMVINQAGDATFNNSVTAKNALISWSGASSSNLLMRDLSGNNKYEMGWEATTNNFYIYSYGGSLTPFRISPSGNTLLGSPADNSFKLQVLASGAPMMSLGTSSATGGYLEVRYNTSSVNGYLGAGNQLVISGAVADMALTSNTGNVLFATGGGTERMRITSGGQIFNSNAPSGDWALSIFGNPSTGNSYGAIVRGGTNASDIAFRVNNGANTTVYFSIRGDGYLQSAPTYGNTTASAANMSISASGFFERSTSSIKYKKDVIDYDKGLSIVNQLRPVYYKGKGKNDGDKQFAGLIAEEIHDLGLTEFVQYAEDGTPDALAYSNMIALAFKAIQEQQQQIKELQSQINK
jgi:hypothetical protein